MNAKAASTPGIHGGKRSSCRPQDRGGYLVEGFVRLQGAYWVGVAPNDFLLLTRDMETQEVYALNLKGLLSDLRRK